MMALFFGNDADLVREIQSRLEVGKLKFPLNVVIVNDVPVVDFGGEWLDLFGGKRRLSPSTWNTRFFGKSSHINPPFILL
jgi:hypothetical protein